MSPAFAAALELSETLWAESRALREEAKIIVAECKEAIAHSRQIAEAIKERKNGKLTSSYR